MHPTFRQRLAARFFCLGLTRKELLLLLPSIPQNPEWDMDNTYLRKVLWDSPLAPHRAAEILASIDSDADISALSFMAREDISIILFDEKEYPAGLREIANPPPILFVRWKLRFDAPLLAVVGSRKYSSYGESIVKSFLPELISNGFWIVSGWAFGIDSLAHQSALASSGYTIAVIGTGIDIDYPSHNRKLYEQIVVSGGAIVSIFPIGTPGFAYNFPIRNEIIVGLSEWVFAVEAGERSGTLITTMLALDANRDVFVPPGDIGRKGSVGVNRLIRDGLAKCVLSSEDILSEYGIFPSASWKHLLEAKKTLEKIQSSLSFEGSSETILEALAIEPKDTDTLSTELSLPSYEISSLLSLLEIEWFASMDPSWKWRCNAM